MSRDSLTYVDDEGEERVVPSRWEICPTCAGNGTTALHGLAISAEDWADWDDDEREGYLSGRYDGPCEAGCDNGKVRVVDEDRCTPDVLEAFFDWQAEAAADRAYSAMERAMGC